MALARGQATALPLAGQTLRLADWYVRLKNAAPHTVVNETYSLLKFDAQGRVDPAHTPSTANADVNATANAAWPTTAERERMRELLFGDAEAADATAATEPRGGSSSHCSNGQAGARQPTCR